MSKERELLNKAIEMIQIVPLMASIGHAAPDFGSELILEIQELLAQPEQSNEPVVNSLAAELLHNKAWYQKGYGDAKQELKREPLSDEHLISAAPELLEALENWINALMKCRDDANKAIEKAHGIGVDDE